MWMKPSRILAWMSTVLRVHGHHRSCSCITGQRDSDLCVSDERIRIGADGAKVPFTRPRKTGLLFGCHE